jgi:hypothetical protein
MIALVGAADAPHRPPAADLDTAWTWGDGVSLDCYAEAFAGDLPLTYVPLMLMLQGAAATAVLAARSDCCGDCQVAAFKHRLVVTHHLARSLEKLANSAVLGQAPTTRVNTLLTDPAVADVLGLRALRNGLVHLGLSDVPQTAFESSAPFDAVVEHYARGRSFFDVDDTVGRALHVLAEELTEWLLTPKADGVGFAALLRPPAN